VVKNDSESKNLGWKLELWQKKAELNKNEKRYLIPLTKPWHKGKKTVLCKYFF